MHNVFTGVGYSLSVTGNDGKHPDVLSKVTVEFVTFTNATVENSVTMQISKIKATEFLSKYYRPLLEMLQEELEIGDSVNIYSIDEKEGHIVVYLAIFSAQGNNIFLESFSKKYLPYFTFSK